MFAVISINDGKAVNGVNYIDSFGKVKALPEKESGLATAKHVVESTLGDRLRFAIWLGALRLGAWTTKDFAVATGRAEAQFPRWAREEPRPDWSTIKGLASAVGISASWLDDPGNAEAQEPEHFAAWLAARRAFLASQKKGAKKEPMPTRATGAAKKRKTG